MSQPVKPFEGRFVFDSTGAHAGRVPQTLMAAVADDSDEPPSFESFFAGDVALTSDSCNVIFGSFPFFTQGLPKPIAAQMGTLPVPVDATGSYLSPTREADHAAAEDCDYETALSTIANRAKVKAEVMEPSLFVFADIPLHEADLTKWPLYSKHKLRFQDNEVEDKIVEVQRTTKVNVPFPALKARANVLLTSIEERPVLRPPPLLDIKEIMACGSDTVAVLFIASSRFAHVFYFPSLSTVDIISAYSHICICWDVGMRPAYIYFLALEAVFIAKFGLPQWSKPCLQCAQDQQIFWLRSTDTNFAFLIRVTNVLSTHPSSHTKPSKV
jgi:hypothetical protein